MIRKALILLLCLAVAFCTPIPIYEPDELPFKPEDKTEIKPDDPTQQEDTTQVEEPPLEDKTIKAPEHFPEIRITTEGEVLDRDNYVNGTITFLDPDLVYGGETEVSSSMKIRGRGNSTWDYFPKKPYRIKMDEKSKVFGMRSDKDWILLAEYSDKTLIRNRFAMELSRICGMPWTPEMRPAQVWLNGSYQGLYTLSEHKEVGAHKVDISDQGVYLEIGEDMNEQVCFYTGMGIPIMFKDPSEPTQEQYDRVVKAFRDFEAALETSWKGEWRPMIDVKSFVNFFIVEELTKNPDGNLRRSSFMTLDTDGKLRMYHVWDFDLAFGNCDFFRSLYGIDASPSGWFVKYYNRDGRNRGWYYKMFQDEFFVKKVKARWKELYPALEEAISFIDDQEIFLSEVQALNFERWPIMGQYVWPNAKVAQTYAGEMYYLWDFYYQRIRWMDAQISTW